MTAPQISACGIGREGQPLVTIDGFSPAPDALRAAACNARFEAAGQHYPGIRAPLPETYLREQLPVIAKAVRGVFGRYGAIEVIDASFSIVTTPREALTSAQRMPHCDAFTPDRIALVHYLSPACCDGTAFFRHRASGFETITETRQPAYFARLDAELGGDADVPTGYIAGDTILFERIALAEAHYNRALLYPSFLLHSGAIAPETLLSPDPASGRLTVTVFLSVG